MSLSQPVIVYLDQNKWIQIARLIHGVETHKQSLNRIEKLFYLLEEGEVILPLSAIHILETQRIRNPERRKKLGKIMWKYSSYNRMMSFHGIITYEIKQALYEMIPSIPKPSLTLIAYGLEHMFGLVTDEGISEYADAAVEYAFLTGEAPKGFEPPQFLSMKYKQNFANHLSRIASIDKELPNGNWEDFLYAIAITDILEPINHVFQMLDLDATPFKNREFIQTLISKMPTRRFDVHMHTQMFKNKQLKPKLNDLEDWAALGPASMYCDYVICEKHFANMIQRDNFQTKATLCTDFSFIDNL